MSFPCNACGRCCEHLANNPILAFLDRGDGTCVNFNAETRGCNIYNDRPMVCRVDDAYDLVFKDVYTKEEWYKMNQDACKMMKEDN